MYVSMYVCMYFCMYFCMYVCMYVCTYVFLYVCMYVCMYSMYVECMCNLTCGICISSSDCDGFAMSKMKRAVKVSDWSLQSILSINSMALLLTIGSPTYTHT